MHGGGTARGHDAEVAGLREGAGNECGDEGEALHFCGMCGNGVKRWYAVKVVEDVRVQSVC